MMHVLPGVLLAALTMLLTGCAAAPPPPPVPAFAALQIRSVAVGPIASATYQPGEHCSLSVDEELRSALVRELRRRGYHAFTLESSVPQPAAERDSPPLPGNSPADRDAPSIAADGRLEVWIDEYWDNTLCGWEGPKYLTLGAEAVLYAGSPPGEVWRNRARTAEQGPYTTRDLIWVTTTRLTEQLLGSLPAGPEWTGRQ